jgi:hypothetical protein
MKLAFIGHGNVGGALAAALARRGHEVSPGGPRPRRRAAAAARRSAGRGGVDHRRGGRRGAGRAGDAVRRGRPGRATAGGGPGWQGGDRLHQPGRAWAVPWARQSAVRLSDDPGPGARGARGQGLQHLRLREPGRAVVPGGRRGAGDDVLRRRRRGQGHGGRADRGAGLGAGGRRGGCPRRSTSSTSRSCGSAWCAPAGRRRTRCGLG